MTPSRPYLLRALYEWILDNDMTPHVVVNATYKDVIVPKEHVENGQIILSIAPESIHGLEMKNEYISFAAKFGGVSRDIYLPIMSITAVYSEENRKGMVFADEVYDEDEHEIESSSTKPPKTGDKSSKGKGGRPKLKIVASNPDLDKES